MILGKYSARSGGGGAPLPRIVQISIASTGTRSFAVTIHEEGSGLTFRQMVEIERATETRLLTLVVELHRWSVSLGLTAATARRAVDELGRTLHRVFLGRRGGQLLDSLEPTAVMLDVDESVLGLPWELLRSVRGRWVMEVPFGRIVTTTTIPVTRRDPVADDPVVKILAVVNPTDDLAATDAELAVLRGLAGGAAGVPVELDVLEGKDASRRGLAAAVRGRDHDIIHFAGHASFDSGDPHESALVLADGPMPAEGIGSLGWSTPPYLVFNSACESARAAQGRRLVTRGGKANGLAAGCLAAGCEAYVGHFWPVGDSSAAAFASSFYETLFREVNFGAAVVDARRAVRPQFDDAVDLAAVGAVFFGDAGSAAQRRDLAQAV